MISSEDHLQLLLEKLQTEPIQIIAHGQSMSPCIRSGTRLLIQKYPIQQIKNGMILLVISEHQGILIHRLCFRKQNQFYLKGDSLPRFDDLVNADCIEGVVIAYAKHGEDFKAIPHQWYFRYFWMSYSIFIGLLKLLKDYLGFRQKT